MAEHGWLLAIGLDGHPVGVPRLIAWPATTEDSARLFRDEQQAAHVEGWHLGRRADTWWREKERVSA